MKFLSPVSRLALFFVFLSLVNTSSGWAQVRGLPDFTELVEKQGPTVVNISTTQHLAGRRSDPLAGAFPFDENDPRFEFFRRFFPRPPHGAFPREPAEAHSLGSGFITSPDGYILTNAHVVEGADEITVRLTDKREFSAKIVGSDKRTDVALLKIEASNLPFIRPGDTQVLKPGEWVLAIGSPFGFDHSVTAGIVSAKGRALPQENFVPFIQTDVAINPGNSGGPLFNMKGEVVGINSQIYSRSGGYMGVSFAIPIELALEIATQLRTHGKVSRGRIGVAIQEVTKELAEALGLTKPIGVIVGSVEKGGPADKAGLEAGDVILKFEGKPIANPSDLPRWVGATRPGTRANVQIWRKGQIKEVSINVGEIPEERGQTQPSSANRIDKSPSRLGLALRELSAEQKRNLKLNHGLLVEDSRNLLGKGDLRSGDILLSFVHQGVVTDLKTVEQFNHQVNRLEKGSNLTLLIRRGELQTFITIKNIFGN